jgi:hypothetical protein
MASQEMILKLIFNDDGTFKGLEQINAELKKTDDSATKTEEAVKSLAKQFSELKKQQEQYKPNTKEFKELTLQMAELKKQMKESADAVVQNTQPAVEGLRGTFATMKEQVMNFNFEGLTESLKSFTVNLARVNVSSITGSLKAMLAAGVQGFKTLGNVIKKNPIFILVGVLIAVIAYWEELSDFVTGKSKMLENLKAQAEALKAQEQSLTRELALQKALGAGAAAILRLELDLLKNKQAQAETAMKIAYAEKNREEFLTAQQAQLQAINDLELAKVKINTDAQALLDKIRAGTDDQYNKQLLQNQAFSEYKIQTERLGVLQEDNNRRAAQLNNEIAAARKAGNNALADDLVIQRESLKLQNISLQANKDEIWNAGEAAKDTVKTEKELEAIAKAKAAAAERKAKADAESKRIRDEAITVDKEIVAIEKALADSKKTEQKREIDDLLAAQKVSEDKYKADERSAKDMRALNIAHSIEMQLLLEKYKKINQDAADEQAAKDKDAADKRKEDKAKELQDLQAIIDAADKGNIMQQYTKQQQELIANDEYYQQLISQAEAAKISSEALVTEQARKENEIKKKYQDEEVKLALQAANDKLEIAQQGMTALSSLGDAYFSTQLANVEAGSKAELNLKKKQFAFNKKMQIGGAIMDTAKAITAAIAANPFPSPTLPVSIALASITGAAQIAKIASTKFDGGSGTPAPPSIPTGGGNAPAIDFSGANMQVNAPGTVETYVLAGNVANALEARQKIIDQSHL